MNADVALAIEYTNKARVSLTDENYEEAMDFARKAYIEAKKAQQLVVSQYFTKAKEYAKKAKSLGINVKGIMELLVKAKQKFDSKDYDGALELATIAYNEAEKKVKTYEDAKEGLEKVRAEIESAKEHKIDTRNAEAMYVDAEAAFKDARFDDVLSMISKIREEIETRRAQYTAAKLIIATSDLISLAKDMGIDVSSYERELHSAKDAMKNKEYIKSLEIVRECVEKVENLVETRLNREIGTAEREIEEAKNIGIDLSSAENLLAEAKEKLSKKMLKGAYADVSKCLSEISAIKEYSEKAAMAIQKARVRIGDAESLNADASEARAALENAIKMLKGHDYKGALESAIKAEGLAEEAIKSHILSVINKFEEMIEREKAEGMVVENAERLISEAKKAFEEGRYQEALNLAMESEGEIQKADLQHRMATDGISSAQIKVKELDKEGIVDTEAHKKLYLAKDLYKKGDYVNALKYAMEAAEEATSLIENYRVLQEMFGRVKGRLSSLTTFGIDVDDEAKTLSQAKKALQQKKFNEAREMLEDVMKNLEERYSAYIKDRLEFAKSLIERAAKLGYKSEQLDAMAREVDDAYNVGEYNKMLSLVDEIAKECHKGMRAVVESRLNACENGLKTVLDAGISDKMFMSMLNDARKKLGEEKYEEALAILNRFEETMREQLDKQKKVVDAIYAADSAIHNAKKFGLDVKNAELLLEEALGIKSKEPEKAMELAVKAKEDVERVFDAFGPNLTIDVPDKVDAMINEWNSITVKVKNIGRGLAKDVSVSVDAKNADVADAKSMPALAGGGEKSVEVKFMPKSLRDVSLRIKARGYRVFDGHEVVAEALVSVEVLTSVFKRGVAEEAVKCPICKGTIKPGLSIITCKCGATYHEQCAMRRGVCPNCGVRFRPVTVAKKKAVLKL
ncbi:MAG: hypothetical protein DRN20_02585 [Thermoplasmata archaeon]|nr:MAG: hypothetical protein DRN20_02585 [Thermoplasmata archaeon]